MSRANKQTALDVEIWDCICSSFKCDVPFDLEQATEVVRAKEHRIRILPYDYALGRVLGALQRIEPTTTDLWSRGQISWSLPSIARAKNLIPS